MKKKSNMVFIVIVMGFLAAGFVKTFFFPSEINSLENRYANQVGELTLEGFADGSYQKQMADALNDQVPAASLMKMFYNWVMAFFEDRAQTVVLGEIPREYVSYRGGWRYGEHLVNLPSDYEEVKPAHDKKLANIAAQVKAHPEVEFFAYYIERDTDIDFETGKTIGAYEHLEEAFAEMGVPYSGFRTLSYEDYHKYFYKTDHHWNCYGSYQAYLDVLELLGVEEAPLEIQKEWLLDYAYYGSKTVARGAHFLLTEPFPAYEYDYPAMDISINGKPAEDYGAQSRYLQESDRPRTISYADFYGNDFGEIILDAHREDRPNILLIGESYDNPLLKIVAPHFNKTYSIDLRNYQAMMGEEFAFSAYLEENHIDQVLLIGSIGYFTMEEFMLED